jgi:hypothetical protein
MKRKPLSKKLRFEVFKRDSFKCQYCGAKPPKVPIEVDHIVPVSNGGKNDELNLITSCFDCNRGKSNNELDIVLDTTISKVEKIKIAQEQYRDIKKLLNKEKKIINEQIDEIESVYSSVFEDFCFSAKFRISVKNFISKLSFEDVLEAIEISCNKPRLNSSTTLTYFCGVCWNKIKENE